MFGIGTLELLVLLLLFSVAAEIRRLTREMIRRKR
jgi:hypothetical protein